MFLSPYFSSLSSAFSRGPKVAIAGLGPLLNSLHCHLVLYDSLGKIIIFKQKESKKVLVKRMEHLFNVTHHSDVILTKAD